MTVLKIKSENKDLSWVIIKNPESGIAEKKIRQGMGYGWFPNPEDPTTYVCYFKDRLDYCSFSETGFEYLDQTQYSSMLVNWALINTLLSSAVRKDNDKDIVCHQEISFFNVTKFNIRSMEHFVGWGLYDIKVNRVGDDIYDIVVSGNSTIKDILNFCMVMAIFVSPRMKCPDNDFFEKYCKVIQDFDFPYFLRYLFIRNYLSEKDSFQKYAHLVSKEGITFNSGDTSMQRLRAIEKQLTFTNPILDIGCGEGFFAINITRKNKNCEYVAMDIDEDLVDVLKNKADARKLNITTFKNHEDIPKDEVYDILLVEVIEHMPLEEAKALIRYIYKNYNFETLYITTPNKDFNKYYYINEGEFRHDDHKWEMNFKDFKSLIVELFGGLDVCIDFQGIGDSVDGDHTSSCAVITNRNIPKKAIITIGPSGCGKSTFAKRYVENGWTEINRDNIRFTGKPRNYYKYTFNRLFENKVTNTWNQQLKEAIEEGKNIIVSDTNLNPERLQALKDKLVDAGYLVKEQHFQVDFEELLKRNYQREGGIPYEVILNQHKRYQNQYNPLFKPYEYNPDLPSVYIFDIDGTLAELGDRSPFDMTKVDLDTPIPHVAEIFNGLAYHAGKKIIFFSGRSEDSHGKTVQWLSKHLHIREEYAEENLFMREVGDNRKDFIIKAEMFNNHIRGKCNVICVFDDRKQVIEQCWNVLGVPVVNVGNNLERF